MENNLILLLGAVAVGVLLQIVVRLSGRSWGKWKNLALEILKDVALLLAQLLLIAVFSGDGKDHTGCFAASCCTFGLAIAVQLLQTLFKRKYPLSDEQKMRLTEL